MARIYLASSWRNEIQQPLVQYLRNQGHAVYDFKNPAPGQAGFSWSEIDPDWQQWTAEQYTAALKTPIACQGYTFDMRAMEWADTCVLLLPCGRSAHLEAGWFAGRGKRTIVMTRDGEEPELMALMCNHIVWDRAGLLAALKEG